MVRHLAAAACSLALLLSGCASLILDDTTPLSQSQLNPPGAETISNGGYRLDALATSPDTPDLLVLLAFSGGGKRSSAYAYGVLKGMRDVSVATRNGPRRLLDQVDGISGISGGSFTATYYGLHREATFTRFEEDFLYRNTNANVWGIYLLPWNWGWLIDPTLGTNDYMAEIYDRTMFQGARFDALAKNGRPLIAVGATEISSGTPFIFGQENFDLICADVEKYPLARAVAASAAFPGLFSPITLTNRAEACADRKPGWLRRVSEEQRHDPLSRLGAQAELVDRYLDADRMRFVHLADGGVADNLGVRQVGGMMQNLSVSPDSLTARGFARIRRIVVITVDGQATQDYSVAQRRAVGGILSVFGLVSGSQINRLNFETMITLNDQLQGVTRAISAARCAQGLIVDGAPCDDVSSSIVRLSLGNIADFATRTELQSIPTTLSLSRDQVDSLVAAGLDAVTTSQPLQKFLADYPARSPVIAVPTPARRSTAALPRPHVP